MKTPVSSLLTALLLLSVAPDAAQALLPRGYLLQQQRQELHQDQRHRGRIRLVSATLLPGNASEEKTVEDEPSAAAVEEIIGQGGWTSNKPDSTDYNKETHVSWMPLSVESMIASIYCLLIASAPLLLAALAEEQLTRAHMLESVALIAWLGTTIFLFTNVLKFQSSHFTGHRPLTIVEAVYLLSQILTTVGYGDITPAYPRGQVWVGVNVIIGLCLYASIVMEIVSLGLHRMTEVMSKFNVAKSLPRSSSEGEAGAEAAHQRRPFAGPLMDWEGRFAQNISALVKACLFFFFMVTIGVLFWHFAPGEEKTWLQAIYMSIITLSTVGFGWFNAVTEAGKIFAAFWMLIGVSSLGAMIGAFIDFMLKSKQAEIHKAVDDVAEFKRVLEVCKDKDGKLDKKSFMQFSLMLTRKVEPFMFELIDARFNSLCGEEVKQSPYDHVGAGAGNEQPPSVVRRTIVLDSEGPPLP